MGSWSSGGNLNTARKAVAGCGTQTAGLSFGGYVSAVSDVTEEYDGSSWAAGGDLNTARYYLAGAGTQIAGLSFGGLTTTYAATTEEYDGSSWAAAGNLNTARSSLAGAGTQSAGLSFGGYTTTYVVTTEEYDGAAWAAGGDLNTARFYLAGAGTQTAGLSFGGLTTTYAATTEEYDGAAWSSGGDLSVARYRLAGCGTQTAGLSFGGNTGSSRAATTEEYDGASWTATGDLNTAREQLAGAGDQSEGLSIGGYTTTAVATTEEFLNKVQSTTSLSKTISYALPGPITSCEAAVRRIHGKVTITYSDPLEDTGKTITSSGEAYATDADDTVDSQVTTAHPWFNLQTNVLDGTYYPMPTDTIGWWSSELSDINGYFAAGDCWIQIEFTEARTVQKLEWTGDSVLEGYPVNFTVKLYDSSDVLQHTETVTANASYTWTKMLASPETDIKKVRMDVTRINKGLQSCRIVEFWSLFEETYEDDDLFMISLLEEMEYTGSTIPIGNMSSNEITVRIDNSTGRFDMENPTSPVASAMLKNRKIEAWLGVEVPYGGTTQWQSLGVFWSQDWRVYPDAPYVEVVGLDRLSMLAQSEWYTTQIYTDQTLSDLAGLVLADAGLDSEDYEIDPVLDMINIPYTWFNRTSHRHALKEIAEACLGIVYCDRDGVIQIKPYADSATSKVTITSDKYFSKNNPVNWNEICNYVEVQAKPRVLGTQGSIYNDIESHTVPASSSITRFCQFNTSDPCTDVQTPTFEEDGGVASNITITDHTDYTWATSITFANSDTSDHNVTLIDIEGKVLGTAGNKVAVAEDAASITTNGKMALGSPIENNYIQTKARAQDIADAILASYKDPRRDVELDCRGYTTLYLGDRISVPTYTDTVTADYTVIRQEITWDGGMRAKITGRRIT